jgi:hypothetical protein
MLLAGIVCTGAYYSAVFLSSGTLYQGQTQANEIGDEWLVVSAEELDLGRVYETDSFEHTFHIKNRGDRPVTIIGFEKTCDCLGIMPDAQVMLQPQESREFAIKLALVARTGDVVNRDGEPFQVRFGAIYLVDGGVQTSTNWSWRLSCQIIPTIRFKPSTILLGTHSDRVPVIEHSVAVEAANEVHRIEWEVSPPSWTVEVVRDKEKTSPNRFRVVIRSQGRLTPCQVSGVIQLTPVGRGERQLPSKELKFVGEIVHDVIAVPGAIHIGRQPHGFIAEEAIRFISLTNRRFRIKGATSGSSDLDVSRTADEEEVYSLRLRITKPGDQEEVTTFAIQDEDGTEFTIAVPFRYHGITGL